MPIRAWIDEEALLVRFEIVGEWTTQEMVGSTIQMLDAIGGRTGFDLLSDNRMTKEPVTPDQVRALVGLLTRQGSALIGRKAAVVVATEASYGMMRMLGAMTEKLGIDVGIHSTVADGLRWLGRESSAPPQ